MSGAAPDVHALFADAHHGRQMHYEAAPFGGKGVAAGTGGAVHGAGGQHGLLAHPLPGHSLDGVRRDVADGSRPLGSLGHTVGLAEDVVLPLVEVHGAVLDEPVIVGVVHHPLVGDGLRQGGVGAGTRGQPLVGHVGGSGVAVRVDEDGAYAQLAQPLTPDDRLLAAVATGGGVGVHRPVDHLLGVLHGLGQHVEAVALAKAPVPTPGVHAAPVPAFPAVRVVQQLGVAQDVVEPGHGAHLVVQKAVVVVRGDVGRDGGLAVGALHALDLAGHQVESLVPGDALVLVLAAQLRVPLAVGVEVLALHGVLDAVLGVHAGALSDVERVDGGLARVAELLALGFDSPVTAVFFGQTQGTHARDDPVLDGDLQHAPDAAIYEILFCHNLFTP